jgi:hypothetical protein
MLGRLLRLKKGSGSRMLSDLAISQSVVPDLISSVAARAGIEPEELELHGNRKAKVSLRVRQRLDSQRNGHYVVVTGINPTPLGEVWESLVLPVFYLNLYLGKEHDNRWPLSGPRCPSQQEGFHLLAAAISGADVRHQGICSVSRYQPPISPNIVFEIFREVPLAAVTLRSFP